MSLLQWPPLLVTGKRGLAINIWSTKPSSLGLPYCYMLVYKHYKSSWTSCYLQHRKSLRHLSALASNVLCSVSASNSNVLTPLSGVKQWLHLSQTQNSSQTTVCACVRVLDHGVCLCKSAGWLQAKGIQSQNKKLQHKPPDFPGASSDSSTSGTQTEFPSNLLFNAWQTWVNIYH